MERKRDWVETTNSADRADRVSKPPVPNGHWPLKWGAIGVLVGYVLIFVTGVFDERAATTAAATLGSLLALGGFVTWIVGMTLRIRFNRSSPNPLPFTTGEKVALIGGAVLVAGILLVNGTYDSDGVGAARIVGIAGFVAAGGGTLWHLLTPRQPSGTR